MADRRVTQIIAEMKALADPERATHAQKYFRTAQGQYGAGDRFLGIRVPQVRKVGARFRDLSLSGIAELLGSDFHEIRFLALVILVNRFPKADDKERQAIYDMYMRQLESINNWDLVDCSAPAIVGGYLQHRSRSRLYELARSSRLWDRRIAVLATFWFIRDHDFNDALALAELLVQDEEDLVQKAVGWMLREIGNRDRSVEEQFLLKHHGHMPRTMLRYAVEKFPKSLRERFMYGGANHE